MGIVSAKPPYRHGIRKILTAAELGISLPKKKEEVKPETPKVEETIKVEEPAAQEPETIQETAKVVEQATETGEPQPEEAKEEEKPKTLRELGFSKVSRSKLKVNGIETCEALQAFLDSGKQISELDGLDEKNVKTLEEEIASIQNK